jgi:hypothetical protein
VNNADAVFDADAGELGACRLAGEDRVDNAYTVFSF